jgi:polyribonucleotide nucleotidyltransferase
MMVEGEAKECSEEELVQCLEIAHEAIRKQIKAQAELRKLVGITEVRDYKKPEQDEAIREKVYAFAKAKVDAIARLGSAKHERSDAFSALKKEIMEHLGTEITDLQKKLAGKYYEDLKWEVVRDMMVDSRIRLDGRQLDEVRPLAMEIGPLPTPHGSSLFTRGETQSLTTVTLGTKLDELMQETAASAEYAKFFLHYNFPPFSTGEVKMMRGVGRREVGHGNLAMRSLKQMLPDSTVFPYTLRVVSDILESNGSSSMASVCGGSLALMDAGMPLKAHVAGIAMGLIKEGNKFAVLSDILGDEDHLGDMDFKVAGTANGITALQMDIKIQGITKEIMQVALAQAKEGRVHILGKMQEAMPHGRTELSNFAPRLITIRINPEKIRDVIGKGGAVIRALTEETGTQIDITDEGIVTIASVDAAAGQEAKRRVEELTASVEVGKIYDGVVLKLLDFGAIVQVMPGKDGLLHISQIANERVNAVADYLKEGQQVRVKVLETDDRGRLKLSMKAVLAEESGDAAQTQQ